MSRMLIVLLLCLAALTCAAAPESRARTNITVDGLSRDYLAHMPPGKAGPNGYPVVLVLHGGGGNAEGMARVAGWDSLADREGFLAIYPDGSGRFENKLLTWNAGNCCGYARKEAVNDVHFLHALIADLKSRYRVDPDRIFVTGFSNGAMMAYRAACELSDEIAAVAPVSGALNVTCKPSKPVSLIAFHGTADRHVPYDGGAGDQRVDPSPRVDASVEASVGFWVRQDRCAAKPELTIHGKIQWSKYHDCADGTAVSLVTVFDGGHAWPGGTKWAFWADEPTREISATAEIWGFFKSHPRAK